MNLRIAALLGLSAATTFAADAGGANAKIGKLLPFNRTADHAPQNTPDAAAKNLAKAKLPVGFTASIWASEPMLSNPVAFCFDGKGRIFTSETNRYRSSVLDIRHYYWMIEDDLASRNQADWTALIKKNFPNDWQELGKETETIRVLEDSNGDGKADQSAVYATGFNSLLDGIASGVLWHDGALYFTNIPSLWKLTGDAKAEKREEMFPGFGVRFSYTGHDFHGLAMGPDGRLYFSIGDRGVSVKTKEGAMIEVPDEGAVFRCEPDGSHLELVMRGLRNPQELAFDNYGNLFTGDNDSDQGDRERWVVVTEGADAGWRIGYQHHPLGKEFNPWIAENMWEPRDAKKNQPAYVLSPIANLPDGPSGLVHYPGTGLPAEYAGSFFLAGYKGSTAKSAVNTFKCEPDGAGFKLTGLRTFMDNVQATDVDFGPDSRFYVSAWDEGWERSNQGRIYTLSHDAAQKEQAAQIAEVREILRIGFARPISEELWLQNATNENALSAARRTPEELMKLLGHADQRVRLGAQRELVVLVSSLPPSGNKWKIYEQLKAVAKGENGGNSSVLRRLHAITAIMQAERIQTNVVPGEMGRILEGSEDEIGGKSWTFTCLTDENAIVRTHLLRAYADLPKHWSFNVPLTRMILKGLADPEPKARFFAALALARPLSPYGHHVEFEETRKLVLDGIVEFLRKNSDRDEYLRHAGVIALAKCADDTTLTAVANDENRSIRLGALLAAARKWTWPVSVPPPSVLQDATRIALVTKSLNDSDALIAAEGARLINDAPISAAMPALAKLAFARDGGGQIAPMDTKDPMFAARVLNANFRTGDNDGANRLALFAARAKDESLRVVALTMLAKWAKPPGRDFITGTFRPLPERGPSLAAFQLNLVAAQLLTDQSERVRIATCEALSANGVKDTAPHLLTLVKDTKAPAKARLAAFDALAALDTKELADALAVATADSQSSLKTAASRILGRSDAAAAAKQLADAYASAELDEKKGILTALGDNKSALAGEKLSALIRDFANQPAAVQLELIGAAEKHPGAKDAAAKWRASLPKNDMLAAFRMCVEGGDVENGKTLFKEHAVAACAKCHKVDGVGGDAGPELTGFAAKNDRAYILESIINVNAKIAPGFQMMIFTMKDGGLKAGLLKSDENGVVTLQNPGMPAEQVKAAEIAKRETAPSGMIPNLGEQLTPREIRDIVEYMATLK